MASKSITRYGYDLADRLISAAVGTDIQEPTGDPKFKYDYDAASNLLTIKRGSNTSSLTYSATNGITTSVYDANGNTSSQNAGPYTWDAADRIVKAVNGTTESTFTYDGESRIVRIVNKSSGTVTKDRSYLWCGLTRCAERDNLQSNSPVAKRYFAQGELANGSQLYYGVDYLGSVRQLIAPTGTISVQYAYESYGTRSKASGTSDSDAGFASLWVSQPNLFLAAYRSYDHSTGDG